MSSPISSSKEENFAKLPVPSEASSSLPYLPLEIWQIIASYTDPTTAQELRQVSMFGRASVQEKAFSDFGKTFNAILEAAEPHLTADQNKVLKDAYGAFVEATSGARGLPRKSGRSSRKLQFSARYDACGKLAGICD